MSIIKHTYDYEILLRLNEEGLQGAHFVSITQIKDDETGEVFGTTVNEPVSLSIRDGDTGRPLSDVLGAAVAQTIVRNEVLAQEVALRDERITELEDQLDLIQRESE